jgi:hypothetical protein
MAVLSAVSHLILQPEIVIFMVVGGLSLVAAARRIRRRVGSYAVTIPHEARGPDHWSSG